MNKYLLMLMLSLFSSFSLAANSILLTWDRPTLREDGSSIENLEGYNLYSSVNNSEVAKIFVPAEQLRYIIDNAQEGLHTFQISSIEEGLEGQLSDPVTVYINKSKPSKMVIRVTIEDI